MKNKIKKEKNKGAIALILVIMITTLTVLSSIIVAMLNTNDKLANYHISEGQEAAIDISTCIDDALVRIASSTAISGSFNLLTSDVACSSTISTNIVAGFKTVTSTATSTSDLGSWTKTAVVKINVSSSPISIDSFNESKTSYKSYIWCGDGTCNGIEACGDCSADCGVCQVCGDGATTGSEVCDDGNEVTEYCGDGTPDTDACNADCTAIVADETCDDGNGVNESCGDGTRQAGGPYCNNTCSATYVGGEGCDYTGGSCGGVGIARTSPTAECSTYCNTDCSACTKYCL